MVLVRSDLEILDSRTLEIVGRWPLGNDMISALVLVASTDSTGKFLVTERSQVTSSLWSAQLDLGNLP